ncbi:MAG: bifunctional riboflavin kinase/FAD synthetase [Bacteroidales bacterium]|nr:bifunctional riboflavin kinase/FAD synthetase [Bacteroidales bacterium]
MQIFKSLEEYNIQEQPVATIGTFDGVHLGHKAVIKHLISEAKKRNTKSLLITFEPHPRIVLNRNAKELRLITNIVEKAQHLENVGLDYLLILPFTYDFSQKTAREFIKEYLIEKLNVQAMTIGYDHNFGNMNAETEDLETLIRSFNIEVERIPEMDINEVAVSSTKIREAIKTGKVSYANSLLGYNYQICGTVVHGNKLGRELGFPTANLMLKFKLKLIPADGVYMVKIIHNNVDYKGMMNIGYKPTVQSADKTIEVHIIDFDNIIYGENIQVFLIKRIRNEISFMNIDELKSQLQKDKNFVIENY